MNPSAGANAAIAAGIVTGSFENAILDFASSDHLAILNELTQGAEPLFDYPMKSTECLPNFQPPLYRGRFSIRLLRSIGDHIPFTIFSTDPPETFPTKKLATSNAIAYSSTCTLSSNWLLRTAGESPSATATDFRPRPV